MTSLHPAPVSWGAPLDAPRHDPSEATFALLEHTHTAALRCANLTRHALPLLHQARDATRHRPRKDLAIAALAQATIADKHLDTVMRELTAALPPGLIPADTDAKEIDTSSPLRDVLYAAWHEVTVAHTAALRTLPRLLEARLAAHGAARDRANERLNHMKVAEQELAGVAMRLEATKTLHRSATSDQRLHQPDSAPPAPPRGGRVRFGA